MNYRVIIGKCDNPVSATDIASEIALQTGRTPESVYGIITAKTTCIRKKADDREAKRLKTVFEALGAVVDLVPSQAVVVSRGAVSVKTHDDSDNETPGRLLSSEEYIQKINLRKDIFYFEGNRPLKQMEMISLIGALITGFFLSNQELTPPRIDDDFYDREAIAGKITGPVDRPPKFVEPMTPPPPETPKMCERKILKPENNRGRGSNSGGGGDPRAHATSKGVLGIIAGQITGKALVSADIFGKGGFAADIDAILSGVNGLRAGGSGGVGRKRETGIGFGPGYGSGFNGGSGGIGDIECLMHASAGSVQLKKHEGHLEIRQPRMISGGSITSGRSKTGIMRVVMQNISALRYAYNMRLRDKPGLDGKITVRFAIDEFGKVIFCQLQESTISDTDLETTVLAKIKAWRFDKIDKPGDITEVVYPFVFSQ